MSCILHIETSTSACSVAISNEGENVFEKKDLIGPSHNVSLGVFVDEALSFADSHALPLDAVAVSCGPGSYTGLRIGVSMAKGICYGRNVPLIAIPTLKLLCVKPLLSDDIEDENALLCPMIDARRMEVYSAFFTGDMKKISETEALIIDENSFSDLKLNHHLYLFGDGADKLISLFENEENITVIEKFHCSAAYMARLAEEAFKNNDFVDTAYFEPFYLKDFVPGIPKVKGLC